MRKIRLLLVITILLYLSGCAHKPLCAPYTVLEASPCYDKGYMDGYDDGFNHGRFVGAMKVIETQQKSIKKVSR
jgi:hypothetical protein